VKRISVALVLLAALAAAVLVACGGKGDARPNVVLVVIDTLRPDHLDLYGYRKETAPFLTQLAARGIVFEKARSTSSWTAPATASILTSLHPVQHGVLSGFKATEALLRVDPNIVVNRVPDGAQTAAEAFREAGYSTWGVSDNINVCRALGFDAGFDHFEEFNDLGAAQVNAAVTRMAGDMRKARPYFLYVHYMDPHRPYKHHDPWFKPAPGEWATSISAYDSEIRYVDKYLAELSELLRWGERTLVVVVSDHGEEFLEHGGWDHGRTLYEEVLDVPLVIVPPQAQGLTPRRVDEPVSILDVLPTLRALARLPASARDQGISLIPWMSGRAAQEEERAFFADLRSAPWFGMRTIKSVIRGDLKLIVTLPDSVEFYDLAVDPSEKQSLAAERAGEARAFQDVLASSENAWPKFAQESVSTKLSDEALEKLKSLGYLK